MSTIPETLEDWKAYVAILHGPELLAKAKAANSLIFVKTMQEEGMEADDIVEILRAFAQRMRQVQVAVPTRYDGAYMDLTSLL